MKDNKKEQVPTQQIVKDGWDQFLHWVYCPDGPGPCKCDKK